MRLSADGKRLGRPPKYPDDEEFVPTGLVHADVRPACDVCGEPTALALIDIGDGANFFDLCAGCGKKVSEFLWAEIDRRKAAPA